MDDPVEIRTKRLPNTMLPLDQVILSKDIIIKGTDKERDNKTKRRRSKRRVKNKRKSKAIKKSKKSKNEESKE
jgi:hypothetical protein